MEPGGDRIHGLRNDPEAVSAVTIPRWLVLLAVATFALHLAFGIYYAVKIESSNNHRLSLATTGIDYLRSFPGWDTTNELDSASNNRAAVSVLRTGVPRSREGILFLRAPVYAYFVAMSYAVGGIRLLPIVVAQAALSAIICLLVGLAAGQLAGADRVAWVIPPFLYFVNLRVAMYMGYVIPLILPLFFTAVTLWAAMRPPDWKQVGLISASTVLGVYSQAAYFVVGFAVATWFSWRFIRFKRKMDVVGTVVVLLFIGAKFPLTWLDVAGRAYDPARADDRGGTLWLANNPYYDSMKPWSLWELRPGNPWTTWQRSDQDQERYDRYLARASGSPLQAALLWMRENPLRYATVCAVRFRTEFSPYTGEMSPRNRLISTIVWLLIFPAGLCGLWKMRARPVAALASFMILAVFGFDTLFIEEPYLRYRMPIDLLLTMFAGVAYCEWLNHWRGANPSTLMPG